MATHKKAALFKRYPWTSVLIYNGSTVLHFLLGGTGLILGYRFMSWAGYLIGAFYLAFSFAEMYLLMPLVVCPRCAYYRIEGSLCISGLNVVSRRIAREGDARDFARRARGLFCPNNLYLAALVLPVAGMIPALIVRFTISLLIIFLVLLGLLLFRFFVIFPKIACLHCYGKFECPQAAAMGVRDL